MVKTVELRASTIERLSKALKDDLSIKRTLIDTLMRNPQELPYDSDWSLDLRLSIRKKQQITYRVARKLKSAGINSADVNSALADKEVW